MDMSLILSVFGTVFLAELGDKTQLATLCFAAQSGKKWSVFIGSSSALIVASLMGVIVGGLLSEWLKPEYVRAGTGVLFVAVGVLMITGKV